MARLLHIFFDVDMRAAHPGLREYAKRRKVDVANVAPGDCVLFVNKAWNRLKMFAGGGECLVYLNLGSGRIEPATIRHLPNYLKAGELDYVGALKTAISEKCPWAGREE